MGKEVFCIIALCLILMPFVSAVPPQASIADLGYELRIPQAEVVMQGRSVYSYIHIFNVSNGVPIYPSNSNVGCILHLYNQTGSHVIEETMGVGPNDLEWELFIDGGNLTQVGTMTFVIYCNDSSVGGFVSSSVEVTTTGTILKESDSMMYILLTLGSLFFFLLCLYGGIVLPFRNQRNDESKIISVQKLKYFKVGLFFLSYVFFVWLLNLFLTLSTNFSILTQYTKFFEVIFSVTNSASYPIFVFMLIIMSILAWKDLALKKLLLRGINPR